METVMKRPSYLTLLRELRQDIREVPQTFLKRDPAARSYLEVLLLYPGVRALLWHRIAHTFWQKRHYFIARFISEIGRFLSGVEIHPGASLGRRVTIDHGLGTVIGETAIIEDDVLIYHGVTLGCRQLRKGNRHPIIGAGSVIGAGAKVLGHIKIAPGSFVKAGSVVTRSSSDHGMEKITSIAIH